MAQTVIGIFDSAAEAQQALQQLVSNGFSQNQVDISSASANQNTSGTDYSNDNDSHNNFFKSLFDDEKDVSTYSQMARQGTLVTVHAQSSEQAQNAAQILDQSGAVNVDERAMQYGRTNNTSTQNTGNSLPVIEEELQVGKRVVETGGVRLHSRIIERPVEEHLRLREEHVHIERHEVDRPASERDFASFKEGVIELTEHAEVPIVSKQMQVVEEVSLHKEVEEHTETIRETLRSTDVEVETLGSGTGGTLQGDNFSTQASANVLDKDDSFLDKSHGGWQGALHRMKEVESDYKVAHDDPDVRGWDVLGMNGERLGEVDELIVDTSAMKVRYLEVDIDNALLDNGNNHILIPIGSATLDRDNKNVMVTTLDSGAITNYPAYNGETISRDYEHKLLSAFSPTYQAGSVSNDRFYEGEHFDTNRFSGSKNL